MRGWVVKAARTACSSMASGCATAARHSGANNHAAAGVHGGTHRLPSTATSADRDATRSMTISAGSADGGRAAAARSGRAHRAFSRGAGSQTPTGRLCSARGKRASPAARGTRPLGTKGERRCQRRHHACFRLEAGGRRRQPPPAGQLRPLRRAAARQRPIRAARPPEIGRRAASPRSNPAVAAIRRARRPPVPTHGLDRWIRAWKRRASDPHGCCSAPASENPSSSHSDVRCSSASDSPTASSFWAYCPKAGPSSPPAETSWAPSKASASPEFRSS